MNEGASGGRSRAQNRLTDLFNETDTPHGASYLTRPPQQFETIDARYNELIYGLTTAGEQVLKDTDMWSDWVHKAGGPFRHQREVAKVTAGVEIECLNRSDQNYIQGWKVLERAQTKLRYPVTFKDPSTGKTLTRDLIPDQLYGLEYLTEDGPRYRFYVVEVERGTNPKTSKQDRKSVERMNAMYDVYIGQGKYREHLGLRAPIVLVFHEAQ